MINIQTLLQYTASDEAVVEIENFINYKTLTVFEFHTVFSHLIKLKFELGRYEDVVRQGVTYYERLNKEVIKDKLDLINFIIDAALILRKFDVAYQFIQIYKEELPVLENYKAQLKLIEFKKLTNQDYVHELEALKEDFIPEEIKLKILKELLEIYLNTGKEHKIIDLIDELKRVDLKQTYIPDYFETLYKLNQIDDLKKLAESYKGHQLYAMDAYLALLRIYIIERDFHRATILDADYEVMLENAPVNYKLKIYPLLITLYTELKNKYNIDLFTKKLKQITKEEKKEKKTKSVDGKEIVLETKQEESFTPLKIKPKSNTLQNFNHLVDLIGYSHQISETKNLRDTLRSFFMKLEEYLVVKDLIVFKADTETLFNYKKERLYDKTLLKSSYADTVIYEIIKDGEERFGTIETLKYDKNILTLNKYTDDIKYLFAFPIYDQGVFLVHFDIDVIDPGEYYDLLRGISSILYTMLVDEEKRQRLRDDLQFLKKIFDSNLTPYRIMCEAHTSYNIPAQKLLNADSHMPYEIFLRNLGVHEVKSYEILIERLFSKPNLSDAVTYLYQGKQIRERLISIQDKNEIKIISTYEDLTNYYEERSKLVMEATVDFETSLPNMNALNENLVELIKDKGSFILLSFNESILPIYGYDVAIQFFKEFGQVTKKFFTDGEVYRFSTYQLFLYIPYNDIRSVTKMVKDYLRFVENYESQVINYEKFQPKLSIIRYPVVTEEKNPAKLFRYLELSLDYLKRLGTDEHFIYFEHKIYEDEVFEQQVINYLNEAMNKSQLSLSFNQIIDVDRNVVWQYESELVLPNMDIDSKYLLAIAKKRNRLFDLEKYHIKMVCEFLNTLEKETQKLVKITIPIAKETFTDLNFNPYVFGLFQKYEIPFEFIRFKIKGDNLKSREHITLIDELAKVGIGMDTTSVEVALNYPFNAVHLDYKKNDSKWNDYIKLLNLMLQNHQMALVIRDVKTKEQKEQLQELQIKYIEGPIYKRITADQLFYKIAGN
ncbi:EAL domain-containing protein [Acholeplasma hippikon]|uniref:Cyclic-di-GMP phosphodiesterase n=1 Tax=Acholeplasma hippikon TaxID=264636 RepID=A0A449BJB7_9MOLU|nr:EAL domain-containing protein [Acholeplasma hippikon]VEU82554.1 cyclic-di-GMP phosphodiesterase [Acholeplasma hippikon]